MGKYIMFFALIFVMNQNSFGQKLVAQSFNDQFNKESSLTADTKYLLFTVSMKASNVLKDALIELKIDQKIFDQNNILFVSDIRAMPKAITEMFAIPKMKKYAYSMNFLEDDEKTANWPRKEDKLTLMILNNLEIQEVKYFNEKSALVTFLKGNLL